MNSDGQNPDANSEFDDEPCFSLSIKVSKTRSDIDDEDKGNVTATATF